MAHKPQESIHYLWSGVIDSTGVGGWPNDYALAYTGRDLVPYVPSAPEPSTWAMLLIGFAGIGFAAYRKRRQYVLTPHAVI